MRKLSDIASEIKSDWKTVNFAAKPYLMAMLQLDTIDDNYMYDSGKMIVQSFLANSGSWRGDVAKRIKLELIGMVKGKKISEGDETERVKDRQTKEKEDLKKRQEKEQEIARKKDFEDGEREREAKRKEADRKRKLGIK